MSTMINDTIMNDNSSNIDPEAEVKKLQDLVKKLEQQNQILRGKQNQRDNNTFSTKSEDINTNFTKSQRTVKDGTDNLKARVGNLTLEDVDLLDIDGDNLEEEDDNWLYKSPRKLSPAQKSVSPYKWVRQEFEHPSPEVETAKKSLYYKLEEMSHRISRSSSSVTVGSLTSPVGPSTLPSGPPSSDQRAVPDLPVQGEQATMPSIRPPVFGLGTRVNTATFTRPKNKKQKKSKLVGGLDGLERPVIQDSPMSQGEEDTDGLDDSTGSHKLANVSDVQTLARMQEESLRQSFTSPIASPRKSFSRSLNRSGFGMAESENSPSPQGSPRSSPARFDNEGYHLTLCNQSMGSVSSASEASTPPDSPHSSNHHLDHKPQYNHRKSLPNLSRMSVVPTMTSRGSDSNLAAKESPARASNLATRQAKARQMSPGRALSPQRSGIPSPRGSSGIPRPGTSRLPAPRRSGIPSPRRSTTATTRHVDESWKEGCF